MIKQKVYSFLENLDQLSNVSIGFVFAMRLLVSIYCS